MIYKCYQKKKKTKEGEFVFFIVIKKVFEILMFQIYKIKIFHLYQKKMIEKKYSDKSN